MMAREMVEEQIILTQIYSNFWSYWSNKVVCSFKAKWEKERERESSNHAFAALWSLFERPEKDQGLICFFSLLAFTFLNIFIVLEKIITVLNVFFLFTELIDSNHKMRFFFFSFIIIYYNHFFFSSNIIQLRS